MFCIFLLITIDAYFLIFFFRDQFDNWIDFDVIEKFQRMIMLTLIHRFV